MASPASDLDPVLARYRTRDPAADAARAWVGDGKKPRAHRTKQHIVRRELPLLADALDRLTTHQQKD